METREVPDTLKELASDAQAKRSEAPVLAPRRGLRVWPGAVLVAAYWLSHLMTKWLDATIYVGFLSGVAASLLLALLFSIWWLATRRLAVVDRLFVFIVAIGGGVAVARFSDPSVGAQGVLFMGPPVAFTAWALWLIVARKWSPAVLRNGSIATLVLAWGSFTLARVDGVDGEQNAAMSWRWGRTSEDLYLAERTGQTVIKTNSREEPLVLAAGDWPGFRGVSQQGAIAGVKIATNWNANPPKPIWRQRIGPAWSSVVIVGPRLFTQAQRGESEAVVCLDAATGHERWSYEDKVRFSDGQAGAGPRSSPAFSDGCIYSLGGTGILNCLDATNGQFKWSRNISAESGAPLPMWGFSSSPLLVQGLVVVFAGGPAEKGLLAYRAKTGEPAWAAPTGPISYSSPQPAVICGETQILILSDHGLTAVEPSSGKICWDYAAPGSQIWRVAQPHPIDGSAIVFGSEDLGLMRLDVTHRKGEWAQTVSWKSRALRPAYNDFVFLDGCVYGFDEGIFCCVDAKSGKRNWKAGRYGHGQAILLPDQRLVFVISESGEAILVAARPDKHEELGRFQAINGKTWNHPVIAHGRLFVRNSEEIACYELPELDTAAVQESLRTEANGVTRP